MSAESRKLHEARKAHEDQKSTDYVIEIEYSDGRIRRENRTYSGIVELYVAKLRLGNFFWGERDDGQWGNVRMWVVNPKGARTEFNREEYLKMAAKMAALASNSANQE